MIGEWVSIMFGRGGPFNVWGVGPFMFGGVGPFNGWERGLFKSSGVGPFMFG